MSVINKNLCQLSNVKNAVLRRLDAVDPFVVVAGHYSLADYMKDVSNEGEAEIASFSLGVELISRAIKLRKTTHLVLFVNDIGICEIDRQRIKNKYHLPENYKKIMKEAGLDENYLTVVFESSMRNKASTLLRKVYKRQPELFQKVKPTETDLVRCVNRSSCEVDSTHPHQVYVIEGPDGEKLVVKEGPNPKCNLILATFFHKLTKMFSPSLIVNVFNEIYHYRLRLGLHVGQKVLGNTTSFENLFCDGITISY